MLNGTYFTVEQQLKMQKYMEEALLSAKHSERDGQVQHASCLDIILNSHKITIIALIFKWWSLWDKLHILYIMITEMQNTCVLCISDDTLLYVYK